MTLAVGACRDGEDASPSTTTSTAAPIPTLAPTTLPEPVGIDPFGLGVASGDPDAASVVLWTWIDRPAGGEVTFEVALDEAFTAIVDRQAAVAEPGASNTVRVVVDGLGPDTTYWYRCSHDGHRTSPARTRTAPAEGSLPDEPLTVAQLSCQRFSSGYWTALVDVVDQRPDLVVHCGDYVYEADRGSVRPVDVRPPTDLDGYRALWRRYKAEPELRAAHAVAPWLMVWDDHEVENNYQGTDPGDPPDGEAFLVQRAAAYRAWWEFTPTRLPPPDGPSLRIHRVVDWGGLARFTLLDTRQYRDDQPCPGDLGADLGARCEATATTTMLGDEQEAWFADVATGHDAVWTAVVQQVVLHQWRFLGGNVLWNLDQWDGYTGARRRFLETLASAPSPVVFSGDVHSSWVADLRTDFDDEDSAAVGVEFVGPGVSSDVPSSLRQASPLVEISSPHVAWSETRRRGWVRHTISPDRWDAEYRLVEDASVPDSGVTVASTWIVRPDRRRLD